MPPLTSHLTINDSEEDEEFAVIHATALAVSHHALSTMIRTPQYTDIERGERHVNELINGHPLRLYDATRFHKLPFQRLHDWLLANTSLRSN